MDTRSLLSTLQEKSAASANQIKHVVPFITWWSHIFQSEVSVTQHIIIATNINKHFYFLIRTWTWLFSRRSEMPLKKFSFVFYTYSNFHSFFCFVFFCFLFLPRESVEEYYRYFKMPPNSAAIFEITEVLLL